MNLRQSAVHDFLRHTYDDLRDLLVTQTDPVAIHRIQGQAQLIRRLLELVDPESLSTSGKRG